VAEPTSQKAGCSIALERCINEFDADDVIFEEGLTGSELFVVIEGKVGIAKINDAGKTVTVTLGKGEFFGEMAMSSRCATSTRSTTPERFSCV
jgi:CRP/FNR family cyclic AMP-dependent transcriptional regulator